MARSPTGLDREDIKAAIRKRGYTLESLSREWGYNPNAISVTLGRPWSTVQAKIAAFLGIAPSQIWPDRYYQDGSPKGNRTGAKSSTAAKACRVQVPDAA